MRIRQVIGIAKNVSKTILSLLALLFASCSGTVIIPDGDEGNSADAYTQEAFGYNKPRHYTPDEVPPYRYWNTYRQTLHRPSYHSTAREEGANYSRYTTFLPKVSKESPANKSYSEASQTDDEGDCPICYTEGALKSSVVIQCHECKQCICQNCYNKMDNATGTSTPYDANLGWGGFRVRKKCPFCNNQNF